MNPCFNYNVLFNISDNTSFIDSPKDGIYATRNFDQLGRDEFFAINDKMTGLHIFKITDTVVSKKIDARADTGRHQKERKFKAIYCPELYMSYNSSNSYVPINGIEFDGSKITIDCACITSLAVFKKIVLDPRQKYIYSSEFWLKKIDINNVSNYTIYDDEENVMTMSSGPLQKN